MKWYKRKGLWFDLGLERFGALLCFAGGIAVLSGLIAEMVIAAAVLSLIALIAAGGDVSI